MTLKNPRNLTTVLPTPENEIGTLEPAYKWSESPMTQVPRAGQAFQIQSVYFNFPNAVKENFHFVKGKFKRPEYTFDIELLIGNVQVGKLHFIESAPKEEGNFPMNLVGSIEPFRPAEVFPGQQAVVRYQLGRNEIENSAKTGIGGLLIIYYRLVDINAR